MLTLLTSEWREGFALQRIFAEHGLEFEINQTNAPRIQAKKATEVAAFTAKWGADQLGVPVLRVERALSVKALHGLPGVFDEVLLKSLGVTDLLKIINTRDDRQASVTLAVAFCEPGKDPLIFESGSKGSVIEDEKPGPGQTLAEQLFVPEYRMLRTKQTRPLGELEKVEPHLVEHAWGDAIVQFITWYKERR